MLASEKKTATVNNVLKLSFMQQNTSHAHMFVQSKLRNKKYQALVSLCLSAHFSPTKAIMFLDVCN